MLPTERVPASKELAKRSPGKQLREVRERLQLRYRDVQQASQQIARLHRNAEFSVGLSRLADIENKGTVPSLYRLYSLSAIYKLNIATLFGWYGIELEQLINDAATVPLKETHEFQLLVTAAEKEHSTADEVAARRHTSILDRVSAGTVSQAIHATPHGDPSHRSYAVIGVDDWSMYPILSPGTLVEIDRTKRRIGMAGWSHERERPIYFLSHRSGYLCGWCSEEAGVVTVLSHPSSQVKPRQFPLNSGIDVVGQVVTVTMRLDQVKRRHTHF